MKRSPLYSEGLWESRDSPTELFLETCVGAPLLKSSLWSDLFLLRLLETPGFVLGVEAETVSPTL